MNFADADNGEVRDSRMDQDQIVPQQTDDEIASDVTDDENRDLSTRADRPVFRPVLTPHRFLPDKASDEAMDSEGLVRHRQPHSIASIRWPA